MRCQHPQLSPPSRSVATNLINQSIHAMSWGANLTQQTTSCMHSIFTSSDTLCPTCMGTSCLCGILAILLHSLICVFAHAFIHASMHLYSSGLRLGSYVDKFVHGCPRQFPRRACGAGCAGFYQSINLHSLVLRTHQGSQQTTIGKTT